MLFLTLILALDAIILPTIAQITLSDFQAIAGFPVPCADAYDQTINACNKQQDFSSPNTCTANCLAALSTVQSDIQNACSGVLVDPGSVIGHFFVGSGPAFVCSGIPFHDDGNEPESSSTSSQEATMTMTTMTTVTRSSQASSTTSISVKTKPSSSSSSSQETSTRSPSTVKTTRASSHITTESTSTTSSPSKSTTTKTEPSFFATAANDGTATTFTSKSQQTSSSNPDRYGGGGSPFEISANVAGARSVQESLWLLVVIVAIGFGGVVL
jgi:hypothetical protein